MTDNLIYHEKISSNKTEALFVALTILFLALTLWRVDSRGWDGLAITFAVFCAIFIFYSLNYRTLVIRLTSETSETHIRPLHMDSPTGQYRRLPTRR